jgi:hypothetical protein
MSNPAVPEITVCLLEKYYISHGLSSITCKKKPVPLAFMHLPPKARIPAINIALLFHIKLN